MDDSQREKYVAATTELAETLSRVVENAKKRFSQMPPGSSQFAMMVSKWMKDMADPIWSAYWKWLNVLGIKTRQEMEEIQKTFGDDKDVVKCTEELHAAEAEFRGVAAQLNTALQKGEDKVTSYINIAILHSNVKNVKNKHHVEIISYNLKYKTNIDN